MPGFFTDGELASDPGSIFDYDVTAGEAFGSGFGRQFDTNPLALVARQARYLNDDLQNIAGGGVDWVDAEKAAGEVQSRGLDLKIPKGGIARHELDMLQYLKQREIEQNTTSARTRGVGAAAAGFAGGLAASLTDPINVASGFIPIVNQVRYAQWLARAGEGVFARAAVRAGAGAIEGAVGAAIIEPIVYAGATSEQLDYGLMDSFLNVTLVGVLGGGLHVAGGAFSDWSSMSVTDALAREAVAQAPEQIKRDVFQAAVEALERGEPVDAESTLRAYHGSPHFFEKFSTSKIGTGEGGQAFGHGLYFAQSPIVAENYKRQLAASTAGEVRADREAAAWLRGGRTGELSPQALDSVRAAQEDFEYFEKRTGTDDELAAYLAEGADVGQGALYEVSIRGRADEFVDWDKSISEQPAVVRKALLQAIKDYADAFGSDHGGSNNDIRDLQVALETGNLTGEGAINSLERISGSAQDVALDLRRAGVRGILYFDRESRAAGSGTRNIVVFDDKDVEIVSRNGQPVGGRQSGQRGLSDLIPEARADRTQEAFNRQFVDKADETLAAEKARPKDKIESVKQDEAEFRDMVEEYRGQGRVTAEDDASLKQADELAAWAERRAKAFEAAAGCIEAA